MTTIINRSALIFHGHNPAPDVHSIVIEGRERRVVTWADLMYERRKRQRIRLKRILACRVERVYRLYVAHYGSGLMGGWQAMIDRIGESHWIDRDLRFLQTALMATFRLSLFDDWHEWKERFAREFKRGTQCRQPRGVAFVWWNGHGSQLRSAA